MILREAIVVDAEALHEIEKECFAEPFSSEGLAKDIESRHRSLYFVIEEEGEIIGYAAGWLTLDEGEIIAVAVKPSWRRDGNGKALVSKLIKSFWQLGAKKVFLEVRISNLSAINLYRRFGFTVVSVRKDYYAAPVEDAYVMLLEKGA